MSVVRAEEVVKRYGTRVVVDRVSLVLEAGDALLIRGRSGSGKTTLLHLLAGVDTPTSGRVVVAGKDLSTLDPAERAKHRLRHIGLVFQHFNLVPDLTAEENVRLPMHLAKRPRAKERSTALLARVGLTGQERSFPTSMSGGEMQRVAIARALANEPSLVLADEPTANLDEDNARRVLGLLRGLGEEGRAVLVASHDGLADGFFGTRRELRAGRLVAAPLRAEA